MQGMFDKYMGRGDASAEGDSQKMEMLISLWVNKVPGATPEKVRAVIMRLASQRVPLTNATIGEALLGDTE